MEFVKVSDASILLMMECSTTQAALLDITQDTRSQEQNAWVWEEQESSAPQSFIRKSLFTPSYQTLTTQLID